MVYEGMEKRMGATTGFRVQGTQKIMETIEGYFGFRVWGMEKKCQLPYGLVFKNWRRTCNLVCVQAADWDLGTKALRRGS